MRIPHLFNIARPTAPKWADTDLTRDEVEYFLRTIVSIVVRNRTGEYRVIGSGSIIGVNKQIAIITAAHIFVDLVDDINPPRWRGLPGDEPDHEDFWKRFGALAKDGVFRVIVDPGMHARAQFCDIVQICLSPDYLKNDVALLQLKIPAGLKVVTAAIPFDLQASVARELVLMAGYDEGSVESEDGQIYSYGRNFRARAGVVGDLVVAAEGYRGIPMLRVNMPSLPGMSGGPLLTVWRSNPLLHHSLPGGTLVALAGVISRSRIGTPFLLDHNEDGETWVTPINIILDYLSISLSPEERVSLRTAVNMRLLPSIQNDPSKSNWIRVRE